jgi:hypothetical protein
MNWNTTARRARLMLVLASVACAIALARPAPALAAWPLESGGSITLAFGATYQSADTTSSSIHHGVDIAARAGERVLAPLSGTVSFTGRVPAVGGGTVTAVTLATPQGPLTLMPLASLGVHKGDSIAEGTEVGTLAATGDASSPGSHLHVGLRRGDLYVDPAAVLGSPRNAGDGPPDPAPSPRSAGETARAMGSAAGSAANSSGGAPGFAPAASPARASASSARAALRPAVPGACLESGVSIAGAGAATGAAQAPGAACAAAGSLGAESASAANRAAASRLAPQSAGPIGTLTAWAATGARAAAIGGAVALLGVGMLWPLWRRREGSGEIGVRPVCNDVAAVVGR